jgi:bifunctional NMN adenylyltransferase/nudix hydrolase
MINGVIVARFQFAVLPVELRRGIESILASHQTVVLVLGDAPIPGSANNPLSVAARTAMINDVFPDLTVFHLRDNPNDRTWSSMLDELLLRKNVAGSVVIYGSEERFIGRYSGKFPTAIFPKPGERIKAAISEDARSIPFRQGRVHAFLTNYPKVFPTVDIAVFRNKKAELLLGKKNIDGLWRLPGGFVDPDDTSYEAAANRELKEETGLVLETSLTFEQSFKVDDWRYRYEQDKIITTLFSAEIVRGDSAASDDLAEVKWFALAEVKLLLQAGETVSEHTPMLHHLLNKYLN